MDIFAHGAYVEITLVIPCLIVYNTIDYAATESIFQNAALQKGCANMIKLQNEKGSVLVSDAALSNITGAAATSCFGVKGMAYRSMTDGLVHLLRREAMNKGVHITQHDDKEISIELHIIVEHGVNISAVCRAIIGQVRYLVTENTGAVVRGVNVCVDSMTM